MILNQLYRLSQPGAKLVNDRGEFYPLGSYRFGHQRHSCNPINCRRLPGNGSHTLTLFLPAIRPTRFINWRKKTWFKWARRYFQLARARQSQPARKASPPKGVIAPSQRNPVRLIR